MITISSKEWSNYPLVEKTESIPEIILYWKHSTVSSALCTQITGFAQSEQLQTAWEQKSCSLPPKPGGDVVCTFHLMSYFRLFLYPIMVLVLLVTELKLIPVCKVLQLPCVCNEPAKQTPYMAASAQVVHQPLSSIRL